MPNLRWQELLIIVALVLLLFGAKRLPDAARGLGRSLRIFKAETKGLVEGDEPDDSKTAGSTQTDSATQPSAIESSQQQSAPEPAERPAERSDG
jgi:sec-independent protein translocase protein TatA